MSRPGQTTRFPNPWHTPVVTVPVAAELLGMSRASAYSAADRGELPVIRLDGGIRVPTAELYRLVGLPLPDRPITPRIAAL